MIEVKRLCKHYEDIGALIDIDLTINQGEWIGLVGHNGAGKSTLIKILATLVIADDGSVKINDLDMNHNTTNIRRLLGVVTQHLSLDLALTVQQNICFAAALYNIPKSQSIERMNEMLTHVDLNSGAVVSDLSGGNQRLVDIMRALIHRPRILLLDEATNGLDLNNRNRVWQLIADLNTAHDLTIISSTHYQEEAVRCSRIVALSQGKIANDNLALGEVQSWLVESK